MFDICNEFLAHCQKYLDTWSFHRIGHEGSPRSLSEAGQYYQRYRLVFEYFNGLEAILTRCKGSIDVSAPIGENLLKREAINIANFNRDLSANKGVNVKIFLLP